jgi:hypothetical protein
MLALYIMTIRPTYQSILVARDIDTDDFGKTEVPKEIWVDERSNKSTRGGINYKMLIKA